MVTVDLQALARDAVAFVKAHGITHPGAIRDAATRKVLDDLTMQVGYQVRRAIDIQAGVDP